MPDEATTSASDVERYIETDLTGAEIEQFINDAEAEVLAYNEVRDFHGQAELDRLVKFYTAFLIDHYVDRGGDLKQLKQGSRSATVSTDADDARNLSGFLRERVRANDPSGKLLGGRRSVRTTVVHSREDHYLDDEDIVGDDLVGDT